MKNVFPFEQFLICNTPKLHIFICNTPSITFYLQLPLFYNFFILLFFSFKHKKRGLCFKENEHNINHSVTQHMNQIVPIVINSEELNDNIKDNNDEN